MSQASSDLKIDSYKKRALPLKPKPNSIYYILPENTTEVIVYITDLSGNPIKVIDIKSLASVLSVRGTGVTGTTANPKIDIETFVSSQIGNLIQVSTQDGKLFVKPITSPDGSIEVIVSDAQIRLQLSNEIISQINLALQSGDNISELVNDLGYITAADVPSSTSILREEFTYTEGPQVFSLQNNYYQVYSVEVQGQGSLSLSQYRLIFPNKVEILDILDINDYILIIYGQDLLTPSPPYYTQAQIDSLFTHIRGTQPEFRVLNEIPIGVMNGSNPFFTSKYNFMPETLVVILNGHFQRVIADFITTGNNTIQLTESPSEAESILINYTKS